MFWNINLLVKFRKWFASFVFISRIWRCQRRNRNLKMPKEKSEFEDAKGEIRIWRCQRRNQNWNQKNRQYNGQEKRTKRQTTIYTPLHRKLKMEQHESHCKPVVNSDVPEGWAAPPPTSDTRRVTLVTSPVIIHEWGQDRNVFKINGIIRGHLGHRYSVTV